MTEQLIMQKIELSSGARASTAIVGIALSACSLFAISVFASSTATLVPVSDGAFTQWVPSTGTSHFANVDESPCNGLSDYSSTTVVGNRDSYGVSLASVPNAATITQINIQPCAARVTTGGTNPVMNVFYRFNGSTSADAGAYSLGGATEAPPIASFRRWRAA